MHIKYLVDFLLFCFFFQSIKQKFYELLNFFAIVIVNFFQCTWFINHCKQIDNLPFFMAQSFTLWNCIQRPLDDLSQSFKSSFDVLLILDHFSFERTFHDMNIRRQFTVSADIVKDLFNLLAALLLFVCMWDNCS